MESLKQVVDSTGRRVAAFLLAHSDEIHRLEHVVALAAASALLDALARGLSGEALVVAVVTGTGRLLAPRVQAWAEEHLRRAAESA